MVGNLLIGTLQRAFYYFYKENSLHSGMGFAKPEKSMLFWGMSTVIQKIAPHLTTIGWTLSLTTSLYKGHYSIDIHLWTFFSGMTMAYFSKAMTSSFHFQYFHGKNSFLVSSHQKRNLKETCDSLVEEILVHHSTDVEQGVSHAKKCILTVKGQTWFQLGH